MLGKYKLSCIHILLSAVVIRTSGSVIGDGDAIVPAGRKLCERIAGGEPADPSEFPWALSLGLSSWAHIYHLHYCGGTILTEIWALTSARCVEDAVHNTGLYYWLAGTDHLGRDGIHHTIRTVILHPNYTGSDSWIHDIALVQVNKPFEFSATIQPMVLPSSSDVVSVGTRATVIGWGQVSQTLIQPAVLQKAPARIADGDSCREIYTKFDLTVRDEYQFCAGSANGDAKGVCNGDAGGPLFLENASNESTVIGIVSWNYGCGLPDYPAVYVRVSAYLDWINKIIGHPIYMIPN